MDLEHFEGLLDEVSQVESLPLTVVNLVSQVLVLDLEQVEHREDLSVVRDECFSDGVRASDQCL